MNRVFQAFGSLIPAASVPLPRTRSLDDTRAFLTEGYRYISNRCRTHGGDAFETRLFLKRVVCMRGEEAARLFFRPGNVVRREAASIHYALSSERIQRLVEELDVQWRIAMVRWSHSDAIVLHCELRELLCRAACLWAGVPIGDDVRERAEALSEAIGVGTSFGYEAIRAAYLRARIVRWARQNIDAARAALLHPPPDTALAVIAHRRGADGRLLDRDVAAAELLNVLRPVVSVARYIVFTALAIHHHPEYRAAIRDGHGAGAHAFVKEVRRYHPLFPPIDGSTLRDLFLRGSRIAAGSSVLFDVYGTDHDARLWDQPEVFRPERFIGAHQVAGEDWTLVLMMHAARMLVVLMDYDVPAQNLAVNLSRMPALPATGLVIARVRATG